MMSATINQSMQMGDHHHQRSRLDNVLPENQELINNLHLKIDRRINNGYYYQVAAKRKTLPIQNRYKFQPKSKPKKVHPIIKKPKKINEIISVVDQQQNTDEVQFCEKWQNTSGVYVLKQPDPIVEDEQMQFSCEVTQVQQKNISMQWSIQPIEHYNEEVQYTLQSQIPFIQCRDASIQYSFEEQPIPQPEPLPQPLLEPQPQPQPEPQPEPEPVRQPQPEPQPQPQPQPEVKITYQNAEIQCERIKNEEISVQYNEPLPETKQRDLQINLPDLNQLKAISTMENRLKYLKHEQRKQQRLQRQKEKEIQILKLKQVMQKLEGKIELANQKEQYLKNKIESQILIKENQRKFRLEKQKIRQDAEKQYNAKIENIISKLKQGPTRPRINGSFKEEEQRKLAQLQRQQKISKQQLQNYRKQIVELKNNLKDEMFKRLNYENESDDDTATQQGERQRSNSQYIHSFRKNQQLNISMHNLFPNLQLKNRYAGSIVKNIPESQQRKLNQHQQASRISRAYWRSKSPFDYEYESESPNRINRKYNYLQKLQHKKLQQVQINDSDNPEDHMKESSIITSRTRFNIHHINEKKIKTKYKIQKLTWKWEQLKQIRTCFDNLFANEELFRYLYLQEDKIKLGLKLFQILKLSIDEKIKKSIKIYKYLKYLVFEHQTDTHIQYILFYHHSKTIISGKLPLQSTNSQFYECASSFKNGQIFEYLNQNQLFEGFYCNAQRDGFGILSNLSFHYEGDFSNGKKQGFGKFVLQNGDVYKGQFKNNHFDGEGIYNWINGQKYDGYFKEGLKHGWGKHFYKNGDIYQGQYKNNKRDGKGIYKWKDGSVFQGLFVNDQKCGEGKLVCANGGSIIGQWKADEIIEPTTRKSVIGRSREELPLMSKIKVPK